MGFSLARLAVRPGGQKELLRSMSLRTTGAVEDIAESPLLAADLGEGWTLVLSQGEQLPAGDTLCASLSVGSELVRCVVEEHVMFSGAWGWQDGKQIWSVVHDAQVALEHLELSGQAPHALETIREEVEKRRANTPLDGADWVFDIPVQLAEAVTGFRHDASEPERRFEVLEQTAPQGTRSLPWWKRFFG